jgi:hypothetical protein
MDLYNKFTFVPLSEKLEGWDIKVFWSFTLTQWSLKD